jgi:hypothetical protein
VSKPQSTVTVAVRLSKIDHKMLQKLSKHYRTNSMSHTIRLLIEDMARLLDKDLVADQKREEVSIGEHSSNESPSESVNG